MSATVGSQRRGHVLLGGIGRVATVARWRRRLRLLLWGITTAANAGVERRRVVRHLLLLEGREGTGRSAGASGVRVARRPPRVVWIVHGEAGGGRVCARGGRLGAVGRSCDGGSCALTLLSKGEVLETRAHEIHKRDCLGGGREREEEKKKEEEEGRERKEERNESERREDVIE